MRKPREHRYFVYKRYEHGAMLIGKNDNFINIGVNDDFNFWSVESRGFHTLSAAKKLYEKEAKADNGCTYISVAHYLLESKPNSYDIMRPYRLKLMGEYTEV